jgi:hypothetical protein
MSWAERDLPVLKAIVALADEGRNGMDPQEISERAGLDLGVVKIALVALANESPPFFRPIASKPASGRVTIHAVTDVTGHARRAVETWPSTGEVLAKRIVAALEAAAEAEPDTEKRSKLKQTAQFLGTTGWSVLLGVAGNAASTGIGL